MTSLSCRRPPPARMTPVSLQRRSSTTGVVPRRDYTRTVQSMFLAGPEPGEQRKKDGYGSRLQQNDGLPYGGEFQSRCRLQTRGVHFQEGGGRRRYWCVGKGGGATPPYIGQ